MKKFVRLITALVVAGGVSFAFSSAANASATPKANEFCSVADHGTVVPDPAHEGQYLKCTQDVGGNHWRWRQTESPAPSPSTSKVTPGTPSPTAMPSTSASTGGTGGSLPVTGPPVTLIAIVAFSLIFVGTIAFAWSRRMFKWQQPKTIFERPHDLDYRER